MTENALTTRAQQMHGPQRYVPPDAHFPVSELFTSVQGEGKLTGVRSHFIRLNGCNLRCRWCDTPYASWDAAKEPRAQARAEASPPHDTSAPGPAAADSPTTAFLPVLHDGARLTGAELIASARASGANHIVITGGEPLIFPGIADLCRALMAEGFHITIETAGTVVPRARESGEQRTENRDQSARHAQALGAASPFSILCSLLSLSPKLASSTPLPGDPRDPTGAWRQRHEQRRLNFPAMQALLDAAPDRQIKFVITSPGDLPEIESVLDRLTGWQPQDIFLMPEGVTVPDSETVRWITDAAARRGWQYGQRLHIELFGNTRGT